ncbi:2-succinyl-5-enolpyruvyl-6-hydroxy-3-cyclohexene-1-carboxylate synthase [Vibrio inusitatus NBRC 102082]|uniref:2-succinyl-5-enolpyruvyl-6-hydroxy-3-cyclohexene-1-carboxylate synthase n=1 Tax=Vibrio inusitatus NBRC 102082 TaxID=1219070 RepID=A0A4Y3HX24_9VIBR|nr:2-succinyl-5-enolpyruvyl-6-hydroxy-3-cyclohexene-1-carboxylic-acid synthase [Vibrio inusitatus]GEA51568.1 2-succinyl-5-enolpyruvyl-6-hydroxy-3-cyclohexene-1-carboxylate synthase [Vibrio inusitatus NBRC 102082]
MIRLSLDSLSQAQINRVWSAVLLEEATRFGARHVCIAPGSRSTPLALESIQQSNLTVHTHFDERGLGFFALGLAKATQTPVVVVVTSGTAVANLLPAVVEANLTGEKLILMTADRPMQLVGVGANQAIVQQGLFSSHVVSELNLSSPNASINMRWLLSQYDEVLHIQREKGGPVHINCPFPEPLYVDDSPLLSQLDALPLNWLNSNEIFVQREGCTRIDAFAEFLDVHKNKKGLVIIGRLPFEQSIKVKQLAQQLGWPMLCDPQSGISSEWQGYDVWLQNDLAKSQLAQCDLVVQFGARLVSKRLLAFLKLRVMEQDFRAYALLCDEGGSLNPDYLPMQRFPAQWHIDNPMSSQSHGWADDLKPYSELVTRQAGKLCRDDITELEITHRLSEITDGYQLFLGNSLGVRLVDMVSKALNVETYSNRGASGIDGIVATSAGVASGSSKPTLTLIGDTSLLHDLNSLALIADKGCIVLVLNNDGGAIFDMLPVDENHKQRLYQMPHGFQFKRAAQQFGMGYEQPKTWQQLQQVIAGFESSGSRSLLIEVVTPPNEASNHIKALVSAFKGH